MKKLKVDVKNEVVDTFEQYKSLVDKLIETRELKYFRLNPRYYEISKNSWIIDKYIVRDGALNDEVTENTLSAYDLAIKNKYAITIPVRKIDDGSLVCFAHQSLSKVVSSESGYINKLSLSDIKNLNLNENGEKIPTLEEALDHISGKTPVILDIRNDGMVGKFEEMVIAIIDKYIKAQKSYGSLAIMSSNPYTLEYFLKNYPYVTRILKSGKYSQKMYGSIPTRKLEKLKLYRITEADFICYSHEELPYRKIKKYKPAGVIAYTVYNQNQYMKVAPYCDNIIFSGFKPYI